MVRAALLLPLAALAACAPDLPPVASDLPGDAGFKARIATAFPPGSPAERLRETLAGEGFSVAVDPARRLGSAIYAPPNLPCFSQVRVDWSEDRRGRILAIQAARHLCS